MDRPASVDTGRMGRLFKQTYGMDPNSAYLYHLADKNQGNKFGADFMGAYLDSISPETQMKRQGMANEVFPEGGAAQNEMDLNLATSLVGTGDPELKRMGTQILQNYMATRSGGMPAGGAPGGGEAGGAGMSPYEAFIEAARNRAQGQLDEGNYDENTYRQDYKLGNISKDQYGNYQKDIDFNERTANANRYLDQEKLLGLIPMRFTGPIGGLGANLAAVNDDEIRRRRLGIE